MSWLDYVMEQCYGLGHSKFFYIDLQIDVLTFIVLLRARLDKCLSETNAHFQKKTQNNMHLASGFQQNMFSKTPRNHVLKPFLQLALYENASFKTNVLGVSTPKIPSSICLITNLSTCKVLTYVWSNFPTTATSWHKLFCWKEDHATHTRSCENEFNGELYLVEKRPTTLSLPLLGLFTF